MRADRLGRLRLGAPSSGGFTLLEVMIAIGIFFMVAFTVLALVSQCLRQAGALQFSTSPIGAIASDTMLKTPLEEGLYNGQFDEAFPEHRWEADVYPSLLATNETLMEVVLTVHKAGQPEPEAEMVILKFQPQQGREQPGAFWE